MVSISVIVPVYNKREYLKRSIDSILAQGMRNMEVILVDDVSTDGSYELCKELYGGRPDVRILRQAQNGGAGAARNTGIQAAQGRYLTFVDADDILHPGYLQRLYETALLYHADVVAENGTAFERPEFFSASFAERSRLVWDGRYLTAAYYKIFRTSFLQKYDIRFHPLTYFEDVLFGLKTFFYARQGVCLPGLHYENVETPESMIRGDKLPKCPAYMDSIVRAYRYLDDDFAALPEAQAQPAAREMVFLYLLRLSLQNFFGAAAQEYSLEEINEVIAPVLQREFGANAHYVQMLLNWCIGGH